MGPKELSKGIQRKVGPLKNHSHVQLYKASIITRSPSPASMSQVHYFLVRKEKSLIGKKYHPILKSGHVIGIC